MSAQSSSGGLSHKQLHAQLTQRLEQVLREREQQEQNPPELRAAGKEATVKKSQRLTQPKLGTTEQSGWAKGNGADMSNNMVRTLQFSVVIKTSSAQKIGLIFLVNIKNKNLTNNFNRWLI